MRANFVFFAIALLAVAASADISVTNYTVLPSTLRPGTSGTISMSVTNPDDRDATSVAAEVYGTSAIQSTGSYNFGDFKPGVSTVATIPFTIAGDTKAGIYTLTIRWVYYVDTIGVKYKTLNIPLKVSNPASWQMLTNTDAVFSNDDFVVSGRLRNSGGAAHDVRLTVTSDKFFQAGETPLRLGDISLEENFSLPMTLANSVSSGKYSVPITIQYRDQIGEELTDTVPMVINVNRKVPDFLVTVPAEEQLIVGERIMLKVMVENTGNDDAYSVRVSVANSTILTPLGFSEVEIGSLAAGEKRTVEMDVGVNNVAPGFRSLVFNIRYDNKNGEAQSPKAVSSGANIEAKNDISVFISAKPSPIVSGGAHSLSVLVSNIGSSDVKALSVRLNSTKFKVLDAQEKQFIGGLSQDDFSSVQYNVQVANVPEGEYPAEVTVDFKDAYNRPHTYVVPVMLKVTAAKAGDSPLVLIVGAAAVAICAYLAYRKWFRKKTGAK
jgi:hypothetical protein